MKSIEASELVHTASILMSENTFSQLPVKVGDKIVGSITERGISKAILDGDPIEVRGYSVSEIMVESFPMVTLDTSVSNVIPLLQHSEAVLTIKEGEVVGIVTNTDIGRVFTLL